MYCGFDYYRKMLEAALGEKPDFSYEHTTPCMAKLLFSPVNGIITAMDEERLHNLRNEGISFSLDYGIGDSVEKVKNGTDRIGQVILSASREAELDTLITSIQDAIEINGTSLSRLWEKETSERNLS